MKTLVGLVSSLVSQGELKALFLEQDKGMVVGGMGLGSYPFCMYGAITGLNCTWGGLDCTLQKISLLREW